MTLSQESWARAHDLVRDRLGLEIPDHRQPDLEDALLELARGARLRSPEALLVRLGQLTDDAVEWRRLAERLTIGETYFFRDRAFLDALERHVLPRLAAARRPAGAERRLSLWSAGCSTGEEAYSLAILLDRLLPDAAAWQLSILGTDLNPASLEIARRGVYRPWSLRDTPEPVRERYFERHRQRYTVIPEIRNRVRFVRLNLGAFTPLPADAVPVDVILCRNVLMYLTRGAARRVVRRLQDALAPDGWLAVAAAESRADMFRPLVAVNFPGAILFTSAAEARQLADPGISRLAQTDASPTNDGALPVPAAPARPRTESRSPAREDPASRESTSDLLERARKLADRGDHQAALRLCQSVLERDRLLVGAHVLLAAIHQEQGDLPQAQAALRRALYLDPDCAEAHAALGHLLLRYGERRRAKRHLEAAVRLAGHGAP